MVLSEIMSSKDAKAHFDKLTQLLESNMIQNETKSCIQILKEEKVIFFRSDIGTHTNFNILKTRFKIQTIKEKPFVTGFETLFANVGDRTIENYRQISIYTEQGLFMVHSNFDYSILYGVLASQRTLEDLRRKGFLNKNELREKVSLGWKIKNNL